MDVLDDVLLVAHGADRLRRVFEENDHAVDAVIEGVLFDVRCGACLAAMEKVSQTSSHTKVYLPLLEVVVEVVVHGHGYIAFLHFEKNLVLFIAF